MTKIDKSKLNYRMGKRYKLVPLIERAIAKHGEDEWDFTYQEKAEDHHWHPSTHPMLPIHILYDIASGVEYEPEPKSNSLRKIYATGHFWHQWLQYLCVTAGICTQDDVERRELYSWGDGPYEQIAGSADICPLNIGEWHGGVDYKTMNTQLYSRPQFSEEFDHKYECQMNLYMLLFEMENWLIVAINKDNGEMKEFNYVRNQPLIDAILDKFVYVTDAVRDGHTITDLEESEWPDLPYLGPVLS